MICGRRPAAGATWSRPRWRRRPPGRWSNAPAYLTGPHEWKVFWSFNAERGADLGSVWLMLGQMTGHTASVHTINVVSWAVLRLLWCVGVAVARHPRARARRGWPSSASCSWSASCWSTRSTRRSTSLWLLPLAVMARPRWRDQLIWQGGRAALLRRGVVVPRRATSTPAAAVTPASTGSRSSSRVAGELYLVGDRGARHPPARVRRRPRCGSGGHGDPRRREPRPARPAGAGRCGRAATVS